MVNSKKVEEAGAKVYQLLSECGSEIPGAMIKGKFRKAIDLAKASFRKDEWMSALSAIFKLESVRLSVQELHPDSCFLLECGVCLLVPDFDKIIAEVVY